MIKAELNTLLFSNDLLYVRVVGHVNKAGRLYYRVLDRFGKYHERPCKQFRFLRNLEFISIGLFFKTIIEPGSNLEHVVNLGKATARLYLDHRKK